MEGIAIGYTLSSEEHGPAALVQNAKRAEEIGFDFLSISDHFHPWTNTQGQSPFVWAVLGAISQATKNIPIITGVTAPIMRIHPVILAQATATTALLLKGRFSFGVGSGENLNEHVVGMGWPNVNLRQEMLKEAVEIIRTLWQGNLTDIQGSYFAVDQARIYSRPQQLPPVIVSALGPKAAELAGEIGDGLITTGPQSEVIDTFKRSGGGDKPIYGQITVCFDQNEQKAKETAAKIWPNSAISGQASQELPMPLHFEQLASDVTPDKIAESIVCGSNPQKYLDKIQTYTDAGITHIYLHQVGPNQEGFFDFCSKEILPQYPK